MGDAKRRRDALARFEPEPQDLHVCPACRSRRTVVQDGPPLALSHVPTLYGVCADCKAFWEAYPPSWSHDVCDGSPCDNCAFSAGSPESQDKPEWKSLLAKLKLGQEFKCHKGAPILVDQESGSVEFDEAWVRRHGRTCVGFHRAIMTLPDWLANRYPGLAHVLSTHDQDKLLEGIPSIDEEDVL